MSEIRLSKVEVVLLKRALRSPDGIFVGGITAKMGISMSDAVAAFRSLRRHGFLKQRGASLHLTSRGRGWIMENQSLFAFTGEKNWRLVPDRFKSNRIRPFEPYAPRTSKLSRTAFDVAGVEDE